MDKNTFVMFSTEHLLALSVLLFCLLILFILKFKCSTLFKNTILIERIFALSLLVMEVSNHLVLIHANEWSIRESMPFHLCSFSLFISILLLWTGNKYFYDFVFFAGFGGALQAVLTPSIVVNFPDFRFIQFFYVHIGIILTAFYIVWMKGYVPTFRGVLQTMIALNVLFPFIFAINILVQGNYMFLRAKPINGSLLDFLGPYPWYIFTLEFVAFFIFVAIWLIFRKWNRFQNKDAPKQEESSFAEQNY
ncbi:TIGR02206 family membrane protein [Psychrobacillus vulpis]|uniref:TIGR02206 family membrane protein n=1 Tax=Psychrobacillus vulpis TaxID=2325572 RepID=A0A544TS79_9BACI|nr:TIGR02206 family membrane protein [Psychrobacillus vulpis]TQR20306.1 TIGR02206 family membrane protein [Psychrobacillus vulpis]